MVWVVLGENNGKVRKAIRIPPTQTQLFNFNYRRPSSSNNNKISKLVWSHLTQHIKPSNLITMVLPRASLYLFALFTTTLAQILTASLPGSKLDGLNVEASGQAFYIGGSGPATYCPTQVEPYCPNVTGTFFAGLGALYVRFLDPFQRVYTEY